jgi:hypothetical protein
MHHQNEVFYFSSTIINNQTRYQTQTGQLGKNRILVEIFYANKNLEV